MRRLHTLGRFELGADGMSDSRVAPPQPKRLALLVYLAVASPRGFHRRDTLLGLFWPELGQDEARRALRQALYHLRQVAGASAIATRADDQVALDPTSIWCDAAEFERAAEKGLHAEALSLYEGDFLAGVFLPDVAAELEHWIDGTRSRLRGRAIDIAWRLADERAAAGDVSAALRVASRAHELAPDDENGLRRLLEHLGAAGRRAEAQDVFARFRQHLASEYGESPASGTVELIDRIRSTGTRVASTDTASGQPPPGPSGPASVGHAQKVPASPATHPIRRPRSPAVWAVVAITLLAVIAALRSRITPVVRAEPDAPRDRILVANFTDRTRGATLGAALAEALRVDLSQSARVQVMTTAQIYNALRRMERPLDVPLDDSVARSMAAREGVKAFITGEVSSIGPVHVLSARIVAATSGEEFGAVRETARDSTELIAAVDRISHRLRQRLGETLRTIHADPPLRDVTTGSLEALRLYTRAIHAKDVEGDRVTAVALLQQAVAIDPTFASAFWMLGSTYAALAEPARANAALSRAFANRERLPFRERHLATASYHRNITGEYDRAADAYLALLELYPDDIASLNNLGLVHSEQRRYAEAESLFRRIAQIDSTLPSVYIALAEMLALQSRFDPAAETLDNVRRRFPDYSITDLTATYVAAAAQDWHGAERHIRRRFEAAAGRPSTESSALLTLGQIELLTGRLSAAERDLRASMRRAEQIPSPSRYLSAAIALAWLELRYRQRPAHALQRIDSALVRFPLDRIDTADRPYADLGEIYAALGDIERTRSVLADVEGDSLARQSTGAAGLHMLRGALALAERRSHDAITEFTLAEAIDPCPVCALPGLARAHDQAGDSMKAAETWETYLATPWIWRFESDARHLGFGILRLAELYESFDRIHDATGQYGRFQQLWSGADPELRERIADARARSARLLPR